MQYKPKSIAALQVALGGLPDAIRERCHPTLVHVKRMHRSRSYNHRR